MNFNNIEEQEDFLNNFKNVKFRSLLEGLIEDQKIGSHSTVLDYRPSYKEIQLLKFYGFNVVLNDDTVVISYKGVL